MHTTTGQIVSAEEVAAMNEIDRRNYIPVIRDLTTKEKSDMRVKLYSPCGCGSGKKFKFCCHKK